VHRVLGLMVAVAIAGPAAAAEFRYAGAVFVTDVTTACRAEDWSVGDTGTFVLGYENGVPSFGWIASRSAMSFMPTTPTFRDAGSYIGTYINTKGGASKYRGSYSTFRMRPERLGAGVDSVTLTVKLSRFDDIPGCTVTLLAAGARRP
jgi:hypothetical protein